MKRTLCLILVLAMSLSVLLAIPASAAEDELVNVASGCSYTGTAPYTVDANKYTDNYRNIDGKELTDGVKGSSTGGTEWYALYSGSEYELTVDLGKTVGGIVKIVCEFGEKDDWGITLPDAVTYSGSNDNKSWTSLGAASKSKNERGNYDYTLTLNKGGSYRYVRANIVRGEKIFCFISEFEVFAGYLANLDFNVGSTAFIKGELIRGVSENTKYEDFMAMLNTQDGVSVADADGKAKTKGVIATGDVVTKKNDGGDKKYTVIVDGDATEDGKVDAFDYLLVKTHVLKTYEVKGAALTAADVDLSDAIDAFDYQMVKAHVLGSFNIFEKYKPTEPPAPPTPVDGRGDVTKEYADMDVTDNIKTLTEWDMTFKHTDASTYTMTCKVDGRDLTLTFISRPWGTYNLGAWSVKDGKGNHRFTTGSTDMEYVYRVRMNTGSSFVWSGGNHGNEKMMELKFYNEKGEELNLAVGQSANVKLIHIVEKTQLYNLPENFDKLFEHNDQYYYANAVRTYDIVGPQIRLAVDYHYVKDTYYQKSYTCMMPIEKKLGLYCAGIGRDGKLAFVYETTKKGIKPDYSGTTWQGKEAVRCIIFGYDSEAPYRVDVRVLTPDTSINNNKSKLMFWDMNSSSNKLYYSKYEDSTYTKEAANTDIHTECQWTYFYDATAEPEA